MADHFDLARRDADPIDADQIDADQIGADQIGADQIGADQIGVGSGGVERRDADPIGDERGGVGPSPGVLADRAGGAVLPSRRASAPVIAVVVGAVLAAMIGILAVARGGVRDTVDTTLVGQPAPPVSAQELSGGTFDLSRRRGSWVLLNFFQPSCVPCVNEHPELVAFVQRGGKAELVTVASYPSANDVQDFFARRGGSWPVVLDTDGRIAVSYGVARYPETWAIDPHGVVRYRLAGQTTAAQLDALLAKLSAATPG